VPNAKLKLFDQVREVPRLRHYSLRTERSCCDWTRRYVKFHQLKCREDLAHGVGLPFTTIPSRRSSLTGCHSWIAYPVPT
jgi:hypothetical protein